MSFLQKEKRKRRVPSCIFCIFPFLTGTCGAIAGWAISLMHWLSAKVPSTSEWTYWLIIFSLTIVCAGLPLYRSPKRLAALVACTAAAMLLAMLLGPTASMTPDTRVQQVLAHPFLAFRPTSYVVGAVIGAALGLWLQEIRRFLNRINRLGTAAEREDRPCFPRGRNVPDERTRE